MAKKKNIYPKKKLLVLLAIILAVLVVSHVYKHYTSPVLVYDVYVPSEIKKNQLNIHLRIKHHKKQELKLKKSGLFIDVKEIHLNNGKVYVEEKADLNYIRVAPNNFSVCDVYYTAEFGQYGVTIDGEWIPGRHGHQGYIDENFGLIKGGNVFLYPDLHNIKDVKINFHFEKEWDVVTTWDHDKSFFRKLASKGILEEQLMDSSIGLGGFYDYKYAVKDKEFKVYVSKYGFNESDAYYVSQKLLRIFEFQIKETQTAYMKDYTAIIVPWLNFATKGVSPSLSDKKIISKNSSFGQGLSLGKYDKRDYELFAHRLQHAISHDNPTGMRSKNPKDNWYYEGLAVYYELASLYYAGIVKNLGRWRDFYYNTYLYMHLTDPYYKIAVSKDAVADQNQTLFLHYIKAPIVMYYMDEYLNRSTGGKVKLRDLIRYQIKKYGGYQSSFNLSVDLKHMANVEKFLADYVFDSKLMIIPDIFNAKQYSNDNTILYKTKILATVNGTDVTEADIREYDACLKPMLINDIGKLKYQERFSDILYAGPDQKYYYAEFFNRFGDLPLDMYKQRGYVDLLVILTLLDQKSKETKMNSIYDTVLGGFQGFRAAKRLKFRLAKQGLPSNKKGVEMMLTEEYEKKWKIYIDSLLKTAEIKYY